MKHNTSSTLLIGSTLKGSDYTYHIEKVIGQGSFGITYLATTKVSVSGGLGNIETEIKVAVKEFFMKEFSCRREDGMITEMTQGTLVSDYAKKFRKEAENLAKLQHPNIVNVLEVFDANNTSYYSMEYLAGGSLDSYVKQKGGLPEAEAEVCIRQVGEAVNYMHEHKMLHLDLKPSNVMCSADGKKLVLIDFGLSKQYGENGNPESSTTIGLGTPGYAPLEQSSADRDKDFAPTLDVYALGATYYKLLTGQTPPKASDVNDEGLPIDILKQKGVSQSGIGLIERAMEPRRSKRLKTVSEFLALLSGSSDEEETQVTNKATPAPKPLAEPKPVASKKPTVLSGDGDKEPVPVSEDATPKPSRSLLIVAAAVIIGVLCFIFIPRITDGGTGVPEESVTTTSSSSKPVTGSLSGHDYVDLGLPSGLLWATCNVGASSPSDYGSYFAWGETSPKSDCSWSTLKYCNDNTGDSFSKYNKNQAGTKDNKMRLELSDDAAQANWGGRWRMPTKDEWVELRINCIWTWTSQGGHNGYKVTGKNGNSIFLPAAGWRFGFSLILAGEGGYYWSSSLYSDNSYFAYSCYFYSSSVNPSNWYYRYYGYSVRPIFSSF